MAFRRQRLPDWIFFSILVSQWIVFAVYIAMMGHHQQHPDWQEARPNHVTRLSQHQIPGATPRDSGGGVAVMLLFRAPRWFHLRYTFILQNALANIPQDWHLQLFVNQDWVQQSQLLNYHPFLQEILLNRTAADPRIIVTDLPARLSQRQVKPKEILVDPWFWESIMADHVFLLSGNGVFCSNTMYRDLWDTMANHLDYCGTPSKQIAYGTGETHSYRNKQAMLRVLEYARKHNLTLQGDKDYVFATRIMKQMKNVPFRLPTQEHVRQLGDTTSIISNGTNIPHSIPVVVSGTQAKLSLEERDQLLNYCPEAKVIFPSLHEPACFGAHPDPVRCRQSICALRDKIPSQGC